MPNSPQTIQKCSDCAYRRWIAGLKDTYNLSRCAVHLNEPYTGLLGPDTFDFNNLMFTKHVRKWRYSNKPLCPKFEQRAPYWWEKIKELFT